MTHARTLKVGEAIVSVSVSAGVVASIALMVLAWSVTIVLPIILRGGMGGFYERYTRV